ncbi:hypothetical protein Tco_0658098, partial [Tanacetum coccineum]
YGVLDVRTVIFKISSFKLQNACLLVNLHQTLFDVIKRAKATWNWNTSLKNAIVLYLINLTGIILKEIDEIMVRRADQKLYKFMEGDFPRLYLNDMLLLIVQNKLFNLEGDVIVDLAVALRMYTRRIAIQKRVEDIQLCVESYQKKLNISNPQTRDVYISFKEPYTTHSEPQGVIYKDKLE